MAASPPVDWPVGAEPRPVDAVGLGLGPGASLS